MTPHINAKKGEIAKTVLMPGDPLRAQFIAETFLTDVKKVNSVRNMFMFTGKYQGREISVCGSGMGQPSIGIYSYELFKFYDVEQIIRIGSAGSYEKDLKVYGVLLADAAYSDSTSFSRLMTGKDEHVYYPDANLNKQIEEIAKSQNIDLQKGMLHSSDVFYDQRALEDKIEITKARCVEMESNALFINAKLLGKKAACLLTISDNLVTQEITSPEERQSAFTSMMKIALELA